MILWNNNYSYLYRFKRSNHKSNHIEWKRLFVFVCIFVLSNVDNTYNTRAADKFKIKYAITSSKSKLVSVTGPKLSNKLFELLQVNGSFLIEGQLIPLSYGSWEVRQFQVVCCTEGLWEFSECAWKGEVDWIRYGEVKLSISCVIL